MSLPPFFALSGELVQLLVFAAIALLSGLVKKRESDAKRERRAARGAPGADPARQRQGRDAWKALLRGEVPAQPPAPPTEPVLPAPPQRARLSEPVAARPPEPVAAAPEPKRKKNKSRSGSGGFDPERFEKEYAPSSREGDFGDAHDWSSGGQRNREALEVHSGVDAFESGRGSVLDSGRAALAAGSAAERRPRRRRAHRWTRPPGGEWRRAVVLKEVLGPPLALRREPTG